MLNQGIINPKAICVVGGSNDQTKPGGTLLANLLKGNFQGELYAINPKESTVQGVPCVNYDDQFPKVDLAIIAVSVKFVLEHVEALIKRGVRSFIILSAGFSEMGEKGRSLEKKIVDLMDQHSASLIGPNCIGVLNTHYNGVFAGPIPPLDPKGCDFVSGSGATAVFTIEMGMQLGLRFSSIISVGNSAQIGVEEVVQYWDESYDPVHSSPIKLLYMENIKKPRLLLRHAASLVAKGCRIAAVKAGSSDAGSRAASSHTGALASSDTAVSALFEKAGIVRCHGREELILTASIFSQPKMAGKRMAVITHAGGPGVMLTDTLSNEGLEVPRLDGAEANELLSQLYNGSSVANPIDFLATGTVQQAELIIDYIENKFDQIDGMAFIFGDPGLYDVKPVFKMLHEKMKVGRKPIFPILPSLISSSEEINYFKSLGRSYAPDEVAFGQALGRVVATPPPSSLTKGHEAVNLQKIRQIVEKSGSGYLSPQDVGALLDAVEIPRVAEYVATNQEEAVDSAVKAGFPLVMKVIGPVHKSDVGGVVLGIKNEQEVKDEFDRMSKIEGATAVLLQPMINGSELFVGAKREGAFGHVILCGLGGIFIEVFKDTSANITPITMDEADKMIKRLKSYPIIRGTRGREGLDELALQKVIVKLSALVESAPEISELDINPLLGSKSGIYAVDARIRLERE